MKHVSSIAAAIVVLTVSANGLTWYAQKHPPELIHMWNALGTGCMLALAWIVIAFIVGVTKRQPKHK
jgi:hypothetical protein